MTRISIAGLLIVALVGLSACGGGRTRQTTNVKTTTTGQELSDLKAALDNGVITQAEYDKKRQDILKNG